VEGPVNEMSEQKQPPEVIQFLGANLRLVQEGRGLYTGTAHGSISFEVSLDEPSASTMAEPSASAVIVLGGHKLKVVARDTLADCENAVREELIKLHHDLGVVGIMASAPASITDAILRFMSQWSRLPPLVRAGFADSTAQEIRHRLRRDREVSFFHGAVSLLPRRKVVRDWFSRADAAVIDLFLCLAGQADAEAASMGIDADTRGADGPYDPKPPTGPQMMVGLETAVMQSMGAKVVEEIDAEIAVAWDKRQGTDRNASFRNALRDLVNRFSKENGSNTPDDVLADLLVGVLDNYDKAVAERPESAMKLAVTAEEVAKILRESWDPIGMGTMPDLPADEYASYAPGVIGLIEETMQVYGGNDERLRFVAALSVVPYVASFLTWVRVEQMGLRDGASCGRDAAAAMTVVTAAVLGARHGLDLTDEEEKRLRTWSWGKRVLAAISADPRVGAYQRAMANDATYARADDGEPFASVARRIAAAIQGAGVSVNHPDAVNEAIEALLRYQSEFMGKPL